MHIIFFFHVCLFKQIFSVSVNESNKTKKVRKTESKSNGDEDDKKEQEKPTFSDNGQYRIIKDCKKKTIISICDKDSDSKNYENVVADILKVAMRYNGKVDICFSL